MGRRLLLLCAIWLMGAAVLLSACEPAVPHPIEGRSDCISCHGKTGVKPYPEWHAERSLGNDLCATCHKVAVDPNRRAG